jgi:hypothetical protein
VTGKATDNVAVAKLEIYIDGALAATYNSSSFSMDWNTRKVGNGTHTIALKAYDSAGNTATISRNVSVRN